MQKIRFVFLFSAIVFFFSRALLGEEYQRQDDYYAKFRTLTSHDGLSNNRVLDIKQDAHGFIWLATAQGLNRYDGTTFKTFFHDTNDSTSIPGDYVTSIDFDAFGKMWVGTKSGLACYNEATESFLSFSTHCCTSIGLSNAYVRRLLCDVQEPLLWVETIDGVLNRIDLEDWSISHFKHRQVMTPNYDYHEIYRDLCGKLWVGGRDVGPYYFDEQRQQFTLLPIDYKDSSKKRERDLACVLQDKDSLYWMSATDGFYAYDVVNNTFKKHLATSTFDIIDGEEGVLWLATGGGLCRFEKEKQIFTFYTHSENIPYSLVNNHVNVVFRDKDHNIWVGTAKGLSVLLFAQNQIVHYRHLPEVEGTLSNNFVRAFLPIDSAHVWIGTHGGGVVDWDVSSPTFETLRGTENQKISTIFKDKKGDVWMGMWSGRGFLKYDRSGKVHHYALDKSSLKRDWYNDFYEDKKGRLWVGVWGASGVMFFDRKEELFEDYTLLLPEGHMRPFLDKLALQDDKVWVHLQNSFIHRYDVAYQQMEGFGYKDTCTFVFPEWRSEHHYHYDSQIDFRQVYQIYEDEDSGLTYWGTNSGLFVFKKSRFVKLFSEKLTAVYSLLRGNENDLYVVSATSVARIDESTGELTQLSLDNKRPLSHIFRLNQRYVMLTSADQVLFYDMQTQQQVSTALSAEELEVLTSTHAVLSGESPKIMCDKGLIIVSPDLDDYQWFNMDNAFSKGLISETINDAVMEGEHTFWLATSKGLLLFDKAKDQFVLVPETAGFQINDLALRENVLWMATDRGLASYHTSLREFKLVSSMTKHRLSSHLISFIEEDKAGNIWVGTTDNGVNRVSADDYTVQQFLPNHADSLAFWGEDTKAMLIDKAGRVVVASNKGVNIFHQESQYFSHLTTKQGLPSDNVLGMTLDNEGNIWGVTDKGLAVYEEGLNQFKVFDEDLGLLPYLFNGALVMVGNQMLLATDEGFYAFSPKDVLSNTKSNNLGLTGVKVFANEKKGDFLRTKQLKLNYKENFFTIQFSDFTFSEAKSTYYYLLKGIDSHWVTTQNNYASYTNIKNGHYTFLVTTAHNRAMGLAPLALDVHITPPYWKRTWFILLEMLLALGLMYAIYNYRISHYKLKMRELSLQQQLLRSQMNPHFVFNALIAIQSFIFKNEPKEAGKYLSKFAKLMRLFLQNTRQEFITLSEEMETIEHYLALQSLRFEGCFTSVVTNTCAIAPEELKLPPMMAQPFIENAIEHGFKGIIYPGVISISYALEGNTLEIIIRDNGIGINHSQKEDHHKSLATLITRDRLKSFSSSKGIYGLHIKDMGEIEVANHGTEVRLLVPCHIDY